MSEPTLDKWKGVVWMYSSKDGNVALCPNHKLRLEVKDRYGYLFNQTSLINSDTPHTALICPEDNEEFAIHGEDFYRMVERFKAVKESERLKGATYRDLDNVYTPVLKIDPKPKDERFSIQVEIDETPTGKKLVIYAMDRKDKPNKVQIFIDPQVDKISFDGNDLHPNMIFSKVEAYFKDGKKATLEGKDDEAE